MHLLVWTYYLRRFLMKGSVSYSLSFIDKRSPRFSCCQLPIFGKGKVTLTSWNFSLYWFLCHTRACIFLLTLSKFWFVVWKCFKCCKAIKSSHRVWWKCRKTRPQLTAYILFLLFISSLLGLVISIDIFLLIYRCITTF